jgi:hypothetical protein
LSGDEGARLAEGACGMCGALRSVWLEIVPQSYARHECKACTSCGVLGYVSQRTPSNLHHHYHHHHHYTSSSGQPVGCMSTLLKQHLNTHKQQSRTLGLHNQAMQPCSLADVGEGGCQVGAAPSAAEAGCGVGNSGVGGDTRVALLLAGVARALRSNRPLVLARLPGAVPCDPPSSLDPQVCVCGWVGVCG